MAKWQDIYNSRQSTYEEVASKIQSGDVVNTWVGPCGPSIPALNAIYARKDELENVRFLDGVGIFPQFYTKADIMQELAQRGWSYSSAYLTPLTRGMGGSRTIDSLSIGGYYSGKYTAYISDVCFCMCTPPNESGYVNLSIVGMHGPTVLRRGKQSGCLRMVVAVVNDKLPVVFGPEQWVHVSDIDYFVQESTPLICSQREAPGELEATIGGYVSELIEDGATLQIGWGGITEAVFQNLRSAGKRDLGILTEMMPGGLGDLVEEGIITNKYKPEFNGVSVAAFAFGDQDLYDFVRENPKVNILPSEVSNSVLFAAKHPKLTAINGALQVNLAGEVAAHGLGDIQISGPGGQLEFMTAAQYSPGGKGINVLSSTRVVNGETVSNIVPNFTEGTPVTIPEVITNYVVTEYGVANLYGKSRRQRAEALINIAHPDFRGELRDAMHKKYYFNGYAGGLEYWCSNEYEKKVKANMAKVEETYV